MALKNHSKLWCFTLRRLKRVKVLTRVIRLKEYKGILEILVEGLKNQVIINLPLPKLRHLVKPFITVGLL